MGGQDNLVYDSSCVSPTTTTTPAPECASGDGKPTKIKFETYSIADRLKVFSTVGDVVEEVLDTGQIITGGTPNEYSFDYCPEQLYYCVIAPNNGTQWWVEMLDKSNNQISFDSGGKQTQVC